MIKAIGQITIRDENDITISNTAPIKPIRDEMWLDTSKSPSILKRYNGSTWDVVNDYSEVIEDVEEKIIANTTAITVAQGQISGLISENEIAKGDITTLKNNYTSIKAAVDGINTTVVGHITSIGNLNSNLSTIQSSITQLNNQIAQKVEQTDIETAVMAIDKKITSTNTKVASIETNLTSITSRVSSTESSITTINGNISNLTTKVNTVEQKVTATAITTTISSAINAGTSSINTTQFVMDKTGFTIKNGSIKIKNKAGQTVLEGDVSGNINLTSYGNNVKTTLGNGQLTISNNSTGDYLNISGNSIYLYDYSKIDERAGIEKSTANLTISCWSQMKSPSINLNTNTVNVANDLVVEKNITIYNDLYAKRISGNAKTGNNVYFGNNGCRLEADSTMRLYTSLVGNSDCGIYISPDGAVGIRSYNTVRHYFNSNGTKIGGTMEIGGTVYGMSPTDSPQTLIEYIEFEVVVDSEKYIYLDEIYKKMVSKYVVVSTNPDIVIIEKNKSYFKVIGTGKADFIIKGQRKDADEYFRIMGGLEHGVTEEQTI
ncbi:hypothetical protein [Clostridium sp.]|uniref:hypothetical protein n=1 Tax=Clostridium sp. TaxID=1506 RepID=UPI0025C1F779|nr:hypothetical protein [Clostridium sp.]